MPMKITVILCTYNRCSQLAKALESVANLRLDESVEWEVLVVDNNSGDQTREVVDTFSRRYPDRFRYLFEARQGKSHALNAGIREASGDVLAFMDDDVVVEATWLQNLTAVLQTDEWAGAGGRIVPEREFTPPCWLSLNGKYALAPLAMFDLGDTAHELAEAPYGTNMAFRKRVFEEHGGFRTDLGPCPGSEIRGEDTEFGRRLLSRGERLRYEPSAIVYHSVPKERIQQKYFLAWWYDWARAEVRVSGMPPQARWVVLGVPLYLFRRLVAWTLRWIVSIEPARRFSCRINAWTQVGAIVEWYRRTAEANRRGGISAS
jgi:glycosyltransferase involved in cell wall biosynthesis